MNTPERLQELLDKKDEEIAELREKLEKHERDAEADWEWCHHRQVDESELPVPRLEIRWESLSEDGYLQVWRYALIYRHTLDHLVAIPIGETRTQGGRGGIPRYSGKLSLPFRDGVHICQDAGQLNLPAFAIAGEFIESIGMWDGKIYQEPYAPTGRH